MVLSWLPLSRHLREEVSQQKANKLFRDDMMRDDHLAEPISDSLSSSKIDNGPLFVTDIVPKYNMHY